MVSNFHRFAGFYGKGYGITSTIQGVKLQFYQFTFPFHFFLIVASHTQYFIFMIQLTTVFNLSYRYKQTIYIVSTTTDGPRFVLKIKVPVQKTQQVSQRKQGETRAFQNCCFCTLQTKINIRYELWSSETPKYIYYSYRNLLSPYFIFLL